MLFRDNKLNMLDSQSLESVISLDLGSSPNRGRANEAAVVDGVAVYFGGTEIDVGEMYCMLMLI